MDMKFGSLEAVGLMMQIAREAERSERMSVV